MDSWDHVVSRLFAGAGPGSATLDLDLARRAAIAAAEEVLQRVVPLQQTTPMWPVPLPVQLTTQALPGEPQLPRIEDPQWSSAQERAYLLGLSKGHASYSRRSPGSTPAYQQRQPLPPPFTRSPASAHAMLYGPGPDSARAPYYDQYGMYHHDDDLRAWF